MANMTRLELEAAYLAAINPIHREGTAKLLPSLDDAYLLERLAPAKKASKRGPRMARHCNDRGAS